MKAQKVLLGIGATVAAISITGVSTSASQEYYEGIDSTSGVTLAQELHKLSSDKHTTHLTYDNLWGLYYTSDTMPGTSIIWDIYSDCIYTAGDDQDKGDHKVEGDRYNREHTTPQSWFNKDLPMVADAHHIFATDATVNGKRSNFPFGEVSSASYTSNNGGKLGNSSFSGYSGTVFEPIDEYKGDIARAFMYMAIRYSDVCGNWSNGANVVYQSSYPYLTSYAQSLFTKWAHEDPVSDKEKIRNEAIEERQGNRNPFIDHPEYVDLIWTNSYTDSPTSTRYTYQDVIDATNALTSSSSSDTVYLTYEKYCRLNTQDKPKVTNATTLFSYVSSKSGNSLDLQEYWGNITSGGSGITYTKDEEKIANVISLIDAIPDPVTLEAKDAVEAAKTAYFTLNKLEKAEVTNYSKLEAAMATIETLSMKTFTLITDESELGVGDEVIIVSSTTGNALGDALKSYYRSGVVVNIEDGSIQLPESTTVNRLVLEEGSVKGSYALNNGQEYLASSSDHLNLLGVKEINDYSSWNITIDENSNAKISSNGKTTYKSDNGTCSVYWDTKYTDFTTTFAIPADGAVQLYKLNTGTDTPIQYAHNDFKKLLTKSSLKFNYKTTTVEEQTPSGYSLVTDLSELKNGSQIIFTAKDSTKMALSYTSGAYAAQVEVTKTDNQLGNYSSATVFTVIVNSDGSYSFESNGKYLTSTAAKNISLATEITDNSKWSITISNNVAKVANKDSDCGSLQYNSSASRFTTYKPSSNQKDIAIYVGGAGKTVTKEVLTYENVYLRFGTYMTKDLFDALVEEDSNVKFGVAVSVDGTTFKNYDAKLARVAEPFAKDESEDGEYYQYFAKMLVSEANYGTVVYAKCYVVVNGVTYYTSSTNYSVKTLAKYYVDNQASLSLSDEVVSVLGGF